MKRIKNKIFISLILIIILIFGIMQNVFATTEIENTEIENTEKEDIEIEDTEKVEGVTENISVLYNTHIQNDGWEKDFSKKDGEMSGTSGKSYRLEAIKIKLENAEGISIKYQTHIQDIGWQDWKEDGEKSGTSGKALRLEAIRIKLENSEKYGVMYRTHVQDIGWQDWCYDGETAGTSGQALRLEAIEIKIVEKTPHIKYSTHIQDIGWQDWKKDEKTAGTSGKALRLEGIKIKGINLPEGVLLKYKTHIQNIGWQDWKTNGQISGTSGQSLRLEGIRIKLEGTEEYSVMYRTHVQDIGWQDWCYDGEVSGTSGKALRLEAIQIKIVPKITEEKTKIHISSSINQIENTEKIVTGWVMTNVKNATIKILIDDEEIDMTSLKRTEREDVVNEYKGYGENKKPGFELNVDFSNYTLGKHIIKVQVLNEKEEVIKEKEKEFVTRQKIPYSTGTYGKTGLKKAGDSRGKDLKYYKYGNGPNVFFATYAIHGFEDLWAKDGQELVTIANNFYEYLKNSNDYDLAEKWTIYIFPGINLDGLNYGTTNNGPGRTTLYSQAPANKGIDLNRCWQIGDTYTIFPDNRNYNGTQGFQAYEAQYLRDFLLENKSENGQTILVDLHGWTQQVIGDSEICSYYSKQFPENDKSAVGRYGTGYLINWARASLGSETKASRSALLELPHYGINGHQSVVNNNFSNRYIKATIDMLKNIPIEEVKNENETENKDMQNNAIPMLYRLRRQNKENTKYEVAFAGMIKNSKPEKEEIKEIVEQNLPKNNGIWVEKQSRQKILELFNNSNTTNSQYYIDEEGYLKIEQKNSQTASDLEIEKAINGKKEYILDISSTCYIIDEVTREILDYNFENIDRYQICEYFEEEDKKIIFINENTYSQLEDSDIFNTILKLL